MEQILISKEKLITQLEDKNTALQVTIDELSNEKRRVSELSHSYQQKYENVQTELEQTKKDITYKHSTELKAIETQNMYNKMIEDIKLQYESKLIETRKI